MSKLMVIRDPMLEQDYPEGLKAAKQAAQLAPEDAASTKLVARLEAKHKASLEEEKKKYAKMFG